MKQKDRRKRRMKGRKCRGTGDKPHRGRPTPTTEGEGGEEQSRIAQKLGQGWTSHRRSPKPCRDMQHGEREHHAKPPSGARQVFAARMRSHEEGSVHTLGPRVLSRHLEHANSSPSQVQSGGVSVCRAVCPPPSPPSARVARWAFEGHWWSPERVVFLFKASLLNHTAKFLKADTTHLSRAEHLLVGLAVGKPLPVKCSPEGFVI